MFKNGNKHGGNNGGNGAPIRAELRNMQAEIGLNQLLPILKESEAIPKSLQAIINRVVDPLKTREGRLEQIKCATYIIDKFLPNLQNMEISGDIKTDPGERVNELLKLVAQRLPSAYQKANERDEPGADK